MEKIRDYKFIYCSFTFMGLFLIQTAAGKAGWAVADQFSFDQVDPYNLFARLSLHHVMMLVIAVAIIIALNKLLKIDFGFKIGDSQKGIRYFTLFTAVFITIAVIYHIFMYISHQPLTYDFPLNIGNVLGTLGFQLLLSGPAEEILFRALPVTVLSYTIGKSVELKWDITLEVLLASILFVLAHIKWSLYPFSVDLNVSQLLYAFAMGTVQGMVYQKTRSIIYPILMHSVSNVLMVGVGYLFAVLL